MQEDTLLTASAPQPQGAPPPGQLEGAPPGTAEFVICDCTIEPWLKDVKPWLGLGQYQNRSSWAAVTHLHLVCFAYALLTHLRVERNGAQGQRRRTKVAALSTAAAQDQLREVVWEDWMVYLKEQCHEKSILAELERLRVA
jgi:hypothetical protein